MLTSYRTMLLLLHSDNNTGMLLLTELQTSDFTGLFFSFLFLLMSVFCSTIPSRLPYCMWSSCLLSLIHILWPFLHLSLCFYDLDSFEGYFVESHSICVSLFLILVWMGLWVFERKFWEVNSHYIICQGYMFPPWFINVDVKPNHLLDSFLHC